MGRPRSFDEADVLQKAMDCFWAHGYEACSLDMLCCAMGISRSSFYQAFGNKHDLMLSTLDRYGDILLQRIDAAFGPDRRFHDGFAALLRASIAADGDAAAPRGCYLGNCAAELAASDADAAARLGRSFARIAAAFAVRIKAAQARGEIAAGRDPMALAHLLTAGLQGLRLVAKTHPDPAVLTDIADGLLRAAR